MSSVPRVIFTTNDGERVVAVKRNNKVLLKKADSEVQEISMRELKELIDTKKLKLERAPQKDSFRNSAKAKRDKELMRTWLYSNPLINPFGFLPTKDGLEPIIKNPVIEGLLNGMYGK